MSYENEELINNILESVSDQRAYWLPEIKPSEASIRSAEEKLDVIFPEVYKDFLRAYGMVYFNESFSILGIIDDAPEEEKSENVRIHDATVQKRIRQSIIFSSFLIEGMHGMSASTYLETV